MKKLILLLGLFITLSFSFSQDNFEGEETKSIFIGVGDVTSFNNMKESFTPSLVKVKGETLETLYDEVEYHKKYVVLRNYYGSPVNDGVSDHKYDLKIIMVERIVKSDRLCVNNEYSKRKYRKWYRKNLHKDGYMIP